MGTPAANETTARTRLYVHQNLPSSVPEIACLPTPPFLSRKGRALYTIIVYLVGAHDQPPAIRDLSAITGSAPSNIQYHLLNLEKAGLLIRPPRTCRGMHLTRQVGRTPVIGTLSGNRLKLLVDWRLLTRLASASKQGGTLRFALQVEDTLLEEHICAGDYLLLSPIASPAQLHAGDLLLLLSPEGAALKRAPSEITPAPVHPPLPSASEDSAELVLSAGEPAWQVVGKVHTLVRVL
jgi:SOS-response transcriptional repressor LexA